MPKNDETAGLDFLDFLFTVAISVGLTPELLQVFGITGLLSEAWQKEGRFPCGDELFNVGVFGLGFLNLTLSWFGYHASISSRPLNYFSGFGMVRFILDVSLVIMYGVILVKYKSFRVVLFLLLIVWLIFVIWDVLKIREYWRHEETSDKATKYFGVQLDVARKEFIDWKPRRIKILVFRRELVSLVWCLAFIALPTLYFFSSVDRWVILIGALISTIFYRVNKNHPVWELLFGVDRKAMDRLSEKLKET
jgi:hypothetical protein